MKAPINELLEDQRPEKYSDHRSQKLSLRLSCTNGKQNLRVELVQETVMLIAHQFDIFGRLSME